MSEDSTFSDLEDEILYGPTHIAILNCAALINHGKNSDA